MHFDDMVFAIVKGSEKLNEFRKATFKLLDGKEIDREVLLELYESSEENLTLLMETIESIKELKKECEGLV